VTKPKFTPDPPPVGGRSEERIAWAQRQYARIEDWWPKDLEDRLAALELRFPYKSGTWPIVDSSSVSFQVESVQSFVPALLVFDEAGKHYELSDNCVTGFDGVTNDRPVSGNDLLYTTAKSDLGHFVAIKSDGGTTVDRFDGTTWSTHTLPLAGFSKSGVVWWNDRYILIWYRGGLGGLIVQESTDGQSWSTLLNSTSNSLFPSSGYNALATDGTTLAFCGSQLVSPFAAGVWRSTDGINWTFSNHDTEFLGVNPSSMFYVNGFWWVGTSKGRLYRASTPNGPWTLVLSVAASIETPVNLVYGDGKYKCIVTSKNSIYTSTDGLNFSADSITIPSSALIETCLEWVDDCGFIFVQGSVKKHLPIGSTTWVDFTTAFSELRGAVAWNKPG